MFLGLSRITGEEGKAGTTLEVLHLAEALTVLATGEEMEDYMYGEDQIEELTMDRKGEVILKEFYYLRYILLALTWSWILHHPLLKDHRMKASIPLLKDKMKARIPLLKDKMKASTLHNRMQDKGTLESSWIN